MADQAEILASSVKAAYQAKTPLNIMGAGTKSFLGQPAKDGERLDVTSHSGIIEYDPAELTLVARAGTPLKEIELALGEHDQMLGFEPPFVDAGATLGGAVAAGLAGPRRAYAGGVRDHVLGVGFVNGKGDIITAGGKVMKNVAGFDLFRPMARSMGTLGVLLKIALRVLPRPEVETTMLIEESDESGALKKMNDCAARTQSISAATWDGSKIRIRLSGSDAAVRHARAQCGGEQAGDDLYWWNLNNFKLGFFNRPGHLWRVSVAPMSGPVGENPDQLIDWGGAQRWLKSDEPPEQIRAQATRLGGYAECFSDDPAIPTFHPLEANLLAVSRRFKAALDPAGILNPGRLYPGL